MLPPSPSSSLTGRVGGFARRRLRGRGGTGLVPLGGVRRIAFLRRSGSTPAVEALLGRLEGLLWAVMGMARFVWTREKKSMGSYPTSVIPPCQATSFHGKGYHFHVRHVLSGRGCALLRLDGPWCNRLGRIGSCFARPVASLTLHALWALASTRHMTVSIALGARSGVHRLRRRLWLAFGSTFSFTLAF